MGKLLTLMLTSVVGACAHTACGYQPTSIDDCRVEHQNCIRTHLATCEIACEANAIACGDSLISCIEVVNEQDQ